MFKCSHRRLLISFIGMTLYLLLGALVFSNIEMDREKTKKKEIRNEIQNSVRSTAQILLSNVFNFSTADNCTMRRQNFPRNVNSEIVSKEIERMVRGTSQRNTNCHYLECKLKHFSFTSIHSWLIFNLLVKAGKFFHKVSTL